MKKVLLSFLIMSSVLLLSACGNAPEKNNIQEASQPIGEQAQKETTEKDTTTLNEGKNNILLLSTAAGRTDDIKSEKIENGVIYREVVKTKDDGTKEKYTEEGKQDGPDTLVSKRNYENGKKVMIIAKKTGNKRYTKMYVVYPDGVKDSAEIVSTINDDGTITTEHIKTPDHGYFL